MLRKRLITILTFSDGVLFRTKNFVPDYRYTLNFVDAWDVDEIVILDITREGQGLRNNFLNVVSSFAEKCFVPLTVGGKIRTLEDIEKYLSLGADKVAINSAFLLNPDLVKQAVKLYGSQCVVASVDVKKENNEFSVYIEQGHQKVQTTLKDWCNYLEQLGAGEILVQSIDYDGSLEGYNLELMKFVVDNVKIPVLAASGAGRWQHFVDGFNIARVDAVCTSNIYHFTASSVKSAKTFLNKAGILIRGESNAS